MDLRYSETYEAFRSELRAFLKTHWPLSGAERALAPPAQARLFRQRATEAGYYARAVPRRYGGSEQAPDVLKAAIIAEEVARAGAPAEVRGSGTAMLVPTLLEHGTPVQCERFVPPTLLGDLVWCQGYSEPGAGSDLASLRTRAELRGDHWVINGQKIWTSLAHEAHWMFCLCRTEPDAPKHGGISYLLIDMKTPGLEVRPLRQMTGTADFNEVFFTDVRVPKENLIGGRPGMGFKHAMMTLDCARPGVAGRARARPRTDISTRARASRRQTLRESEPRRTCGLETKGEPPRSPCRDGSRSSRSRPLARPRQVLSHCSALALGLVENACHHPMLGRGHPREVA